MRDRLTQKEARSAQVVLERGKNCTVCISGCLFLHGLNSWRTARFQSCIFLVDKQDQRHFVSIVKHCVPQDDRFLSPQDCTLSNTNRWTWSDSDEKWKIKQWRFKKSRKAAGDKGLRPASTPWKNSSIGERYVEGCSYQSSLWKERWKTKQNEKLNSVCAFETLEL